MTSSRHAHLLSLALAYFLTIGIAERAGAEFAAFLEPGFPFAEITVDARDLGDGFPADNLTPRGLVVRLAADCYIAYDTDLLRVAAAWRGGFLTGESLATMSYQHAKAKKGGGQKVLPSIVGDAIFATGRYPGCQAGANPIFADPRPAGQDPREIGRGALPEGLGRWDSSVVVGERVIVSYEVAGVRISEIPWAEGDGVIGRLLLVGAHPECELTFVLGTGHCLVRQPPPGSQLEQPDGINCLTLPRAGEPTRFAVIQSRDEIDASLAGGELPGVPHYAPHWPAEVTTRGKLGEPGPDYVTDMIPLPMENLQQRNVRPAGIDFFPDGRAAVVTFDGDVWIVSGLDADLGEVTWKRFAGGLHEPQSIRIRDGKDIFVFGRNGITQLIDTNGDGEANVYSNFCSIFWQSAETRDLAHSMAIAPDGSFFISKGGQQNDLPSEHSGRVLKISPDGSATSVFASGLRNAYISLRPGTAEIYASDQQGHWVPATPLHRIVAGGYYGFRPAAPPGVPEPPVTPPLCWIPHAVAGSGLGTVWADETRFGPLGGSLVYLDFQRPGLLRTYVGALPGQAATVPIPTKFDFPLLKGAVNPVDGQLYLVGFQIWGTSARGIRGMARLRYTGAASVLPERVVAGKNAIVLRFGQALDPAGAQFAVRRWNYKRSEDYGSGHFRPDGKAGEELLAIGGIRFSADRRSILVATPDIGPVQQLAVSYDLAAASGGRFSNAAYLTLHQTRPLDLAAEGFAGADLAELAGTKPAGGAESPGEPEPSPQRGAVVHETLGCAGCHSVDGSTDGRSGPTWKGLARSERPLQDGTSAIADAAYLRESILEPALKVTSGYNPKDVGMPSYLGILSDSDIESVILYIQSLAE